MKRAELTKGLIASHCCYLVLPIAVLRLCRSTRDVASQERPDILYFTGDTLSIIEVDEHGHTGYDTTCEKSRIMEIVSAACCSIPLYHTPKSLSLYIHVTLAYAVPIPLYRYHGSARIMGRQSDVASGASHMESLHATSTIAVYNHWNQLQHDISSSILFFRQQDLSCDWK